MEQNNSYTDLGLPSGKLWATQNSRHEGQDYFSFGQAKDTFGDSLPAADDFQELHDHCKWVWDDESKGYTVTGKNGKSIFLPACGTRYASTLNSIVSGDGLKGNYWSRTPSTPQHALVLCFNKHSVNPRDDDMTYLGCTIRLCRKP